MKRIFLISAIVTFVLSFLPAAYAQNIVKVELSDELRLEEALANHDIKEIDSLIVIGKLKSVDQYEIRDISTVWRLTGVNLKEASFEDDNLPEGFFYGFNERVNAPDEDYFPPTDIPHVFTKIKYITLPDNLKRIGDGAFKRNPNLLYVNIPASVSELGVDAFYECRNIFNDGCFVVPENVTVISEGCFDCCIGMRDVKFSDKVTRIEKGAFYNCSFRDIIFPESLQFIGQYAFLAKENTVVTNAINGNIYCKAEVPPVCEEFSGSSYLSEPWPFVADDEKIVYVPVGCAEAYRNAPGWSVFKNFVEISEFPTTGVSAPSAGAKSSDEALYDLNGRIVSNTEKGQIYIKKGTKFVAK